jgi:hypothetical protein
VIGADQDSRSGIELGPSLIELGVGLLALALAQLLAELPQRGQAPRVRVVGHSARGYAIT